MPTSHFMQINEIMYLITQTNPAKLLDIGIGFGKFGFLSREYLELWDGRMKYNDWKREIDGIEVFKDYLSPAHDFIYNNVYVGDVIEILPGLGQYDLILLIDVFEHFSYNEGQKLLLECIEHGKNVLISVPKNMHDQGAVFDNPYETHKFQWRKKHFNGFKNKFFYHNKSSLLVYIGNDARRISKENGRLASLERDLKFKLYQLKKLLRKQNTGN